MVNYLDNVVDELGDALKKRELWDNLLFVTSSDNGGAVHDGSSANNYPLKVVSDWQDGVHVSTFVSGGYLSQNMHGKKTTGTIHLSDCYSTFCNLVDVDPTDERAAKANLLPFQDK